MKTYRYDHFRANGKTGALCGSWPQYPHGNLWGDPRRVGCERCLTRVAKLARSLDAFGRALRVTNNNDAEVTR